MGGHLALRYLSDKPRSFERAVLLAPMVDINLNPFGLFARSFDGRLAPQFIFNREQLQA